MGMSGTKKNQLAVGLESLGRATATSGQLPVTVGVGGTILRAPTDLPMSLHWVLPALVTGRPERIGLGLVEQVAGRSAQSGCWIGLGQQHGQLPHHSGKLGPGAHPCHVVLPLQSKALHARPHVVQ